MATRESCPNCYAVYKVRTGIGRKQVHCQKCKHYFLINDNLPLEKPAPQASATGWPSGADRAARQPVLGQGGPHPATSRRAKRKSLVVVIAMLLLFLGTTSVIGLLWLFSSTQSAAPVVAQADSPRDNPPTVAATRPLASQPKSTATTSTVAKAPPVTAPAPSKAPPATAAAPTVVPTRKDPPVAAPAPPPPPKKEPPPMPAPPIVKLPVPPPPPPAPPPMPVPPVAKLPTPAPLPPAPPAVKPEPLMAPVVSGNGQLAPDVLRRVKRATVMIRVWVPPDNSMASGTGFFGAEPGIVLTNAHVLGMLDAESRRPNRVEVVLNSGEANEQKMNGQILGIDRASDLAVLRAVPAGAGAVNLPPPLEVKSAANLVETQEVFVFGFPLGDQLGKEITVRKSSVASLRKEGGMLSRVQVHGGMDPGNSGGPVVDAAGSVVGVAVAGIRNTQINFAIPGDHVHAMFNGRLVDVSFDHPYLKDGRVLLPASAERVDPLRRLRSAHVEVWTGVPGAPRPASTTAPAARPGDSAHQTVGFDLRPDQNALTEVPLPDLPAGQVYWLQASWVDGLGETRWAPASSYQVKSPPVERKPATLAYKHKAGVRAVALSSKTILRPQVRQAEDHSAVIAVEVKLGEDTKKVDAQGTAEIRLDCKSVALSVVLDNKPTPLGPKAQSIIQAAPKASTLLKVKRTGQRLQATLDVGKVPENVRGEVQKLHEEVLQSLEAVSVPLPDNPKLEPLTSWKAVRRMPIETPGQTEVGTVEVTYTYLGTRTRVGREEAVISMKGVLHGDSVEVEVSGRLEMTAIFDMAAGHISSVEGRNILDLSRLGRTAKLTGTVDVKLERALGDGK